MDFILPRLVGLAMLGLWLFFMRRHRRFKFFDITELALPESGSWAEIVAKGLVMPGSVLILGPAVWLLCHPTAPWHLLGIAQLSAGFGGIIAVFTLPIRAFFARRARHTMLVLSELARADAGTYDDSSRPSFGDDPYPLRARVQLGDQVWLALTAEIRRGGGSGSGSALGQVLVAGVTVSGALPQAEYVWSHAGAPDSPLRAAITELEKEHAPVIKRVGSATLRGDSLTVKHQLLKDVNQARALLSFMRDVRNLLQSRYLTVQPASAR